MTPHEDAFIRLELVDNGLFVNRCNACPCWCCDHDANGH